MLSLFFTILRSRSSALLLVCGGLILWCGLGNSEELPSSPKPHQLRLRAETQYTSTKSNFNTIGQTDDLQNGESYSQLQGLIQGRYDFTRELRIFAQATSAQANTNNKSSTGFNDATFGGEWWLKIENWTFTPDFHFTLPIYKVDQDSTDPLLGDGAVRLQGGLLTAAQWGWFRPFVYAGYMHRDLGLATLMPYRVGLKLQPSSGFWLQGEIRGYQTIKNDENSDERSERNAFLSRANGGSFQYFAMNPQLAEGVSEVGIRFSDFSVYAGASLALAGKNTADNWTAFSGFTWTVGLFEDADEYLAPERLAPQRLDEFQAPTEKYDENLFREPVIVEQPKAPPAPPKRRAKRRRQPQPNVELLLKETERSLEKKKKK